MLVDILVALLFCDSFMFLGIVVDEKKELKFFLSSVLYFGTLVEKRKLEWERYSKVVLMYLLAFR